MKIIIIILTSTLRESSTDVDVRGRRVKNFKEIPGDRVAVKFPGGENPAGWDQTGNGPYMGGMDIF